MTGNPLTPPITNPMSAEFNLSMLQSKPDWYDHLSQVEAAMRHEDEKHAARTDFGWDADEGGYFGEHPLQPGKVILESEWEEETGLPMPEDMDALDQFTLELMKAFAQESDTVSGLHAVAEQAACYCRAIGTDGLNRILASIK